MSNIFSYPTEERRKVVFFGNKWNFEAKKTLSAVGLRLRFKYESVKLKKKRELNAKSDLTRLVNNTSSRYCGMQIKLNNYFYRVGHGFRFT